MASKKPPPGDKSPRATKRDTRIIREYQLSGPRVESEASYWNRCSYHRPVTLVELTAVTEDLASHHFIPPLPADPGDVGEEFKELLDLQWWRNDPSQVVSTRPRRAEGRCLSNAAIVSLTVSQYFSRHSPTR